MICTVPDACGGGTSECTFPVTASSCQPVTPDVRTQGFWKRQCRGPHPSGEPDDLPAYVDAVDVVLLHIDSKAGAGLAVRIILRRVAILKHWLTAVLVILRRRRRERDATRGVVFMGDPAARLGSKL